VAERRLWSGRVGLADRSFRVARQELNS
jgi:hypothetical protein